MAQKPIQQLLGKEMSRREFLAHLGAGALTIVGVSGLVKTLVDLGGHKGQHSGFGSGSYGGSAKNNRSLF
jgi:hypothetical protein